MPLWPGDSRDRYRTDRGDGLQLLHLPPTAHYSPRQVRVRGETDTYTWGDRMLAFHRCTRCGCVTHTSATDPADTHDRMGVNANLMEPEVLAKAR